MFEGAGSRLREDAGKFWTMSLGDNERVHRESSGGAQNGSDIVGVGNLIQHHDKPALRVDVAKISVRQRARLQQQPLMNRVVAEPSRQILRGDNTWFKSRRTCSVADLFGGLFRGVKRQQFSAAGA